MKRLKQSWILPILMVGAACAVIFVMEQMPDAWQTGKHITIETDGHWYYDEEPGADVVAWEVNDDGTVHYLTELEAEEGTLSYEERYEQYGLNFTEEETQAAIALAEQYYADWASEEIDESMWSAEELAENRQIHEWLAAGVEIEYDKAEAVDEIDGTSFKSELERQGAGTIIILKVTVPACTGDTAFGKERVIVLYRDTTQSDWYVKTEGVR